jgi:hypothetical protein
MNIFTFDRPRLSHAISSVVDYISRDVNDTLFGGCMVFVILAADCRFPVHVSRTFCLHMSSLDIGST